VSRGGHDSLTAESFGFVHVRLQVIHLGVEGYPVTSVLGVCDTPGDSSFSLGIYYTVFLGIVVVNMPVKQILVKLLSFLTVLGLDFPVDNRVGHEDLLSVAEGIVFWLCLNSLLWV
jgi:hypothetical protein